MNPFEFAPLLVTGEMRSGTTLVANFLNSQNNCSVYADLLRSLFTEGENLGIKDLAAPLSERERNVLCSSVAAEGLRIGLHTLGEIPREEARSWLDLYRLALLSLVAEGPANVIGTKITCEYRYARQLLDHGVHIVFCIRDPRDVLLSAKNRFGEYNLFKYAESWRRGLRVGRKLAAHQNCKLVLFEDLLVDQRREVVLDGLSKLLEFELSDDFDELRLLGGTRFVGNTSFGDITRVFDPRAGWRWKTRLAEPEVVFTSHFFARELEELGLEPYCPAPDQLRGMKTRYLRYRFTRRLKDLMLAMYRQLRNFSEEARL